MSRQPNLLILMADQMQGQVLRPGHPCRTPHLDRISQRGVRFDHAYTPNAVCSPARASLMTALLPHNHGVLWVTHNVDDDQGCLRAEKPHWAQRLVQAGYRTGYFGQWHVERTEQLERFGWQTSATTHSDAYRQRLAEVRGEHPAPPVYYLRVDNDRPAGYPSTVHYAVTDTPPEQRSMGVTVDLADEFLKSALDHDQPWCCFVATIEPHDPFVTSRNAFEAYDVDSLPALPSWHDPLTDKPNLYRKQARLWEQRTDRQRREAAACYYASITELDAQFGRLLQRVEQAGQMDNTLVVVLGDHGELLGAHGMYCKNISAFEEVYHIPMIVAGPGVARGKTSAARVGLQDVGPTLLDLLGLAPIDAPDSRSFAPVLADPAANDSHYTRGYAEYFGGRYMLTQRVTWDGPWKYIHNGFDFDELYNLDDDPFEMKNLAADPAYKSRLEQMAMQMWARIRETGDQSLLDAYYPILRMAPVGPGIPRSQPD
jgi:arylsulfatase A-like enzyme